MSNVNLRQLQESLDRQPLDEIATLVRSLTYGEMIDLSADMWRAQTEGVAITQENLPALLYRWATSPRNVPHEEPPEPPRGATTRTEDLIRDLQNEATGFQRERSERVRAGV